MDPFALAPPALVRPAETPRPAVATGGGGPKITPPDPGPFSPAADFAPPKARPSQPAPPAAPEWRVDAADGRFEVYGRVEADGWFRYTARRPRFYVMPQFTAPASPCAGGRCPR